MRVESFAIRLRPRAHLEAADLGVRLCQNVAPQIYRSYALVALPVIALCFATVEIATWLPSFAIWYAKPWLDRTILFVLARAAFGQSTTVADVWREQRQVWWSQLIRTWTLRRLSPWRSYTQPVYQLEGLSGAERSSRVKQIRAMQARSAFLMTSAFSLAETMLMFAMVSLVIWFAPQGHTPNLLELLSDRAESIGMALALAGAYALVVLFLEPFYVAAGFAMYINRRVELEAWDIEQELRRAFAR
jgi:hypothetical protein